MWDLWICWSLVRLKFLLPDTFTWAISADDVRRAAIHHLNDCRADSSTITRTPFQKAYNTDDNLFSWMSDPSHKYEFARHNACIRATIEWNSPESLLQSLSNTFVQSVVYSSFRFWLDFNPTRKCYRWCRRGNWKAHNDSCKSIFPFKNCHPR